MLIRFDDKALREKSMKAEYGLERESLRTTLNGKIAMTPHPFAEDKHIDRDFCECQTELITDVFDNADALLSHLGRLEDQVDEVLLKQNEVLWSFSNPPFFCSEGEIPVASFGKEQQHKNNYRAYLARKYGKKKMLFSGIHFNFSFQSELMQALYQEHLLKAPCKGSFQSFKNQFYLDLAARLTEYAWLVVYLTAASPVSDPSFGFQNNQYRSVRCGREGYWNDFVPILDYRSFSGYIQSIKSLIGQKKIAAVSELYYPVRLKPRGENRLSCLEENGVNHIELRVLDVNPLTREGIVKEDIRFLHLLMLYLASLPEKEFDEQKQSAAIGKIKQAALFENDDIKNEARSVLERMSDFVKTYFPKECAVMDFQLAKLRNGGSYAEIVSSIFSADYLNRGLLLAKAFQRRETVCANCSVFLPQRNILQTTA